jgi:hypothetical protein
MKTTSTIIQIFKRSLVVILVLTVNWDIAGQEKDSANLNEFKINIERTGNGFKMYSDAGSAWIDLEFKLGNNRTKVINQYGMTELANVSTNKDSKFTDYLFTISRRNNRITVIGIKGTAWKELSFSLEINDNQFINHLGMIN